MSNNTPTSFASAAAGQSRWRTGDGSGEWARRDGRSNGTMTFRRSSNAPNSQAVSHTSSDSATTTLAAANSLLATESQTPMQDLPPVDPAFRYSRNQLLDIFSGSQASSADVSKLYINGWNPAQTNGLARAWGKSSEGTVPQDPTVCWDSSGGIKPVGLEEMTAEEKEFFTDVNSTLKPQQQKDANQAGPAVNGRKTSVSHTAGHNVSSPLSAPRSNTRRRETSDINAFPAAASLTSPVSARTPRDDSSWFGRKSTDTKDLQPFEDPDEELNSSTGKTPSSAPVGRGTASGSFGSSAGLGGGGPSSLWPSAASGASGNTGSGPGLGSGPGPAATSASAGLGAFGSFALPSGIGEKRFGSTRGESRLAHLMPKQDAAEKPGSNAKAPTTGAGTGGAVAAKDSWRPRPRTATDPFSDDPGSFGGATGVVGAGTTAQQQPFDTPTKNTAADFGLSGLTLGSGVLDGDGPGSPETNPFRSPPPDRGDDDHHMGIGPVGAAAPDHTSNFGSLSRAYGPNAFDGSDRSQTSSVGAKGFPGLGGMTGWGTSLTNLTNLTTSTPDRERSVFASAFGPSVFSPVTGDMQSPGFGGSLPGMFGPPSAGNPLGPTGSLRGTSKLGALFPASMQAQMQGNHEQDIGGGLGDSVPDLRQTNPLGAIGRETHPMHPREAEAMVRPGRGGGLFDDLMDGQQPTQMGGMLSTASPMPQPTPFDVGGPRSSTDTPPKLPRTMVMPDRMRWVYLDPQGQTQGPFTGLEMNDWYKANFFTADLRVKKVEDVEFEPLGQLIRRIGNSREPFLVPQMGIPHGQPSLSGTFAHGDRGTVIPPLVGAFPSYGRTLTAEEQNNLERRKQEEQYMLARQREMMAASQHHPFPGARVPPVGVPAGALHHHSSAHSLQSQPSFGSMNAPPGSGQQPPMPGTIGGPSGFFEHGVPMAPPGGAQAQISASGEFLRDEYNLQERQILAGVQGVTGATSAFIPGAMPTMQGISGDPATRGHLPSIDQLQKDSQGFSERLKEFKQLREDLDGTGSMMAHSNTASLAAALPGTVELHGQQVLPQQPASAAAAADLLEKLDLEQQRQQQKFTNRGSDEATSSPKAVLSLTQQVQKTQAAAAAAERQSIPQEILTEPTENKTDLPMPFPPPHGHGPTSIAAPTAQRTRSTLPDQYASIRSQSETPDSVANSTVAQPPPLAPWARETALESHKGPSLKEIQEAEAKKAAKAEEAAAAARRAAAEQEAALLREREKASAAATPGLPTSSTWANGSPATTTSSSPWAKPSANKPAAVAATFGGAGAAAAEKKKTLADIQREEEARKQKSKESSGQPSAALPHGLGKRYADLASKGQATGSLSTATATAANPTTAAATSASPSNSGWATVGAGGKVKNLPNLAGARSVSSTITPMVKATGPLQPTNRSASKTGTSSTGKTDSTGSTAMEEFNKWVRRELERGISGGIDVNGFAETLQQLPADQTIISEAVYASSTTMDGRHFAEEFIRRKRLAEKGVVEKQVIASSSTDNKGAGGWNEVAKKGSSNHQKEESIPAGFKVVPSRKKGKK